MNAGGTPTPSPAGAQELALEGALDEDLAQEELEPAGQVQREEGPLHLLVVSRRSEVVDQRVHHVIAPAAGGQIDILPDHRPLLATLAAGPLSFGKEDDLEHVALSGGLLEVFHDEVRILARTAERAEDIDIARAQATLNEQEEKLWGLDRDTPEGQRTAEACERARARIRAVELSKGEG